MMSIEEALRLAIDAHRGQIDLDGKPVVLHPIAVGLNGKCEKEIITGFLHDVVEDTSISLSELERRGVDKDVLDALSLLTHKEGQSYDEYVDNIMKSGNKLAIATKINDLKHNLGRNDRKTEEKEAIYQKHLRTLRRIEKEMS